MPWIYKLSLVLAIAAHGADLASTENCLGRGVCQELNPVLVPLKQPAVFGAVKMGEAAGSLWLTHTFSDTHPKWALVLNFAQTGTFTLIAVHNARVTK